MTVDQQEYELFEAAMRVLNTAAKTPVSRQAAIEMLMAWHAQHAGNKSDYVLDAMARHAKQMIGLVRGKL